MKKIFTIFAAVLLSVTIWAQSPEKMSYQAVIRNSSAQLVVNTKIGIEINIIQGSVSGTVVYSETQTPTTNVNGLASIEIGGGTGFNAIDWSAGPFFIETKTAVAPPLTTYTITGTSQLLSVPYAMYANSAATVSGFDTKVDKEAGKGLSTEDYTTEEKTKLSAISGTNTGDQDLSEFATTTSVTTALEGKVDKVTGKSLSTEDFTTAEKTKLTGIAEGAEVNIQADWNQATNTADDYIKNKPTIPSVADGSETKVIAGSNVTVTGVGTTASPYVVNAIPNLTQQQRDALTPVEGLFVYNSTTHKPNYYNGTEWLNYDGTSAKTLAIGDSYQGGIIAYILQPGDPGYNASEVHGIIATPSNQSSGKQWYNGTYVVTGATATAIGTGNANTNTIISVQGSGSYAAQVCADLVFGGYSDWYLPSKDELNKLFLNRIAIGGFNDGYYYWSSSEYDIHNAYHQNFGSAHQGAYNKNASTGTSGMVRAIRAF